MFKIFTLKTVNELKSQYQMQINDIEQQKNKQYEQFINEIKKIQNIIFQFWHENMDKTYKNGTFIGYPIIAKNEYSFYVFSAACYLTAYTYLEGYIKVYDFRNNNKDLIAQIDFHEISKETIYIDETTVYEYQRMGIGSSMVSLMEKFIKQYGYKQIVGSIIKNDFRIAAPFWKKNNYIIIESKIYKDLSHND
jgi:GNAT superfamily N-acetyltransferase